MFGIGAGEFIIILIAGLVIFGPGKLPELGRTLGKGLREFRKAQSLLRTTLDEVSLENKQQTQTVSTNKTDTTEKNTSAENISTAENKEKFVSIDKNVSTENISSNKKISIEKNNFAENQSIEKNTSTENKPIEKEILAEKKTTVSVDDVIQMAENNSFVKQEPNNSEQHISAEENTSKEDKEKKETLENISDKKNILKEIEISAEKKTFMTVYDVIEMSKNNSFVKENIYEKISNGTVFVTLDSDICERIESARSDTDSTGK